MIASLASKRRRHRGRIMGVIAASLALPFVVAAAPDAAAAIRAARAASNAAIAAHDAERAAGFLLPNARVLASGGALIGDAQAMEAAFAKTFTDPGFVTFERRPGRVSVNGATAAERGRWVGRWKDHLLSGDYLARWRRVPSGWRIEAEMFVPTGCRGRACP